MYRALGPSAKETCRLAALSSAALGSGVFVALLFGKLVALTLTSSDEHNILKPIVRISVDMFFCRWLDTTKLCFLINLVVISFQSLCTSRQ